MAVTSKIEEYVMHLDGMERCPECGFVWNDTAEGHYHDCRYYVLQDHEDLLGDDWSLPMDLDAPAYLRRRSRKDTRVRV